MQKFLKILRWIFSAVTVGIVLLLCWQCLDIYLTGNLPENINNGVYLSPVYSAPIVAERLSMVSPLLLIYAVLMLVTVVTHLIWGKPQRVSGKISRCIPREQNAKAVTIARIAILCLGAVFIILGVMNGGSRDVLIKAINICTECIGLG